jgi:hypothetical protein
MPNRLDHFTKLAQSEMVRRLFSTPRLKEKIKSPD